MPRGMERIPGTGKGSLRITHTWQYIDARKYWKCTACGVFSIQPKEAGEPTRYGSCVPGRIIERVNEAEAMGHSIDIARSTASRRTIALNALPMDLGSGEVY